ncbi:hypothetical protein K504DRAFT_464163 [Pleomassaria siparia CBS 279.74]|uniref:Core domain-containing protein n=1 Tax=Pleomassaria siparia CBS 279.74 TaxID=1314801 RepID=A0A6G1KHQ0_9PLEO|nr:hypothetical protein K504DRAFT_464163 [Pleomassaria siparia CBS 279.74]
MSSPSTVCASCLRSAHRMVIRTSVKPPSLLRNQSRAYRIPGTTSQQLMYLDFLAPQLSTQSVIGARLSSPALSCFQSTTSRNFATASPTTSSPQSQPARAILNPRKTEDGTPMLISLAPRATARLSKIISSDSNPNLALRVSIESGGCHGFQYLMNLVDLGKEPPTEEDTVFEGDKGAKVVVDEASLELLSGSTVDYTMELIGSQFVITGIPGATSSCGCGTSFDIKI